MEVAQAILTMVAVVVVPISGRVALEAWNIITYPIRRPLARTESVAGAELVD
jgi:hypothetical protein